MVKDKDLPKEAKEPKQSEQLRSGYTTGACAAAAARAACELLLMRDRRRSVQITLPGASDGPGKPVKPGKRVRFKTKEKKMDGDWAYASVIKDAGDDPDVTNGAEIAARVRLVKTRKSAINVSGGLGVGRVTKPGLAVKPGEAAINPVPMRMIVSEVQKVMSKNPLATKADLAAINERLDAIEEALKAKADEPTADA